MTLDAANQREISRLRLGIGVLAAGWIGTTIWLATRPVTLPPVLALERLEIVEPGGQLAFVLANSQRPAVATIDGRQVMAGQEDERRGLPSFIFYDGKGDEVGGMLMGSEETDDGFSATRHLSLDGYEQDQTIVLSHYQSTESSSASLRISDRPLDLSIPEAFEALGLELGATRDEMGAAIDALPEDGREARLRELFGVPRVFLGSTRQRDAALILSDGQGRPRIVVRVPEEGQPELTLLDEDGETVGAFPE